LNFCGHVERFDEDFKKICRAVRLNDIQIRNKKIIKSPRSACSPFEMQPNDYKYLREKVLIFTHINSIIFQGAKRGT